MQEAAEITVSSVMQGEVGSFELYDFFFLLKRSVRINFEGSKEGSAPVQYGGSGVVVVGGG